MRTFRYPALWAGLAAFWIGLIVWGTLTSHVPEGAPPNSDKLIHFVAYGFVGGWFTSMLLRGWHWPVAVCLILFGCGMEVAQYFTGVRSMDIVDAAANSIGVILGTTLARTRLGDMMGWVDTRLGDASG
jgi:VanZ family protein